MCNESLSHVFSEFYGTENNPRKFETNDKHHYFLEECVGIFFKCIV